MKAVKNISGDEMNLFLPCTHDARAEVKELMMVSKNIVSPQGNRPVMAIVQDALLACSKLTRRDVFLDKARFTNIMSRLGLSHQDLPPPCIHKPKQLWSGKQLFSLVMPKERIVSLERHSAEHDDIDTESHSYNFADTVVEVQSGELLSGILCKKTLGTSSGGLVHKIWTEVSPDAACDFISNVQFTVNNWLVENGFSVGISDCVNRPADQKKVNTIVKASIDEAHKVPETLSADMYEHNMNQILNRARDTSGRLVQKQMSAQNNLYSMVTGGSKGSVINIAQIMACVGQQNVNGQRISHGYDERTLPHFKRKDNTPEGRGFVQHSYMQGLEPHEFFFHAMGGREGVIDTAIKTSDSGYTQRRLVKAMEDMTIHFDGTVRNSIGDIIQFKYGEDNMDGSKLIPQKVNGKKVYLPLDLKDNLELRPHLFGRFTTENKNLTKAFNEALNHMDMSSHDSYVLSRTQDAKITPGEMVGIIAAQSLGQPITQMTLNSVEYNTEIIVSENGKLREYRIGDWIEGRITQSDPATHQYIVKGDQTYAPISSQEDVRILTADEDGHVFWDHVDAVTKHLPINEDGTNTLLRITTLSGHECTVTKGESVLTRQNNKLLKSKGSDLREGDYLPALRDFPLLESSKIYELDLSEYLPKNEFVYSSEVEKALAVYRKAVEVHVKPLWWKKNKGVLFEVPYSRSDIFIDAYVGTKKTSVKRAKLESRPNCVYPKTAIVQPGASLRGRSEGAHVPERLVLDELFGFVIGAYLAEGCVTEYHVLISNNDHRFTDRIEQWANQFGLKYHYDESYKNNGYSRTIRIHSLVMTRLFRELFTKEELDNDDPVPIDEDPDACIRPLGAAREARLDILEGIVYDLHAESKMSKNTVKSSSRTKQFPVALLGAPEECLKGIIDGYFCGDGSVAPKDAVITAYSVSRSLLDNLSIVLRKFGILSSVRKEHGAYQNAIRRGFQTTMPYKLCLNKHNTVRFAQTFTLTLEHKQVRLDHHATKESASDSQRNVVPAVCLSDGTTRDMTLEELLEVANDDTWPEPDRQECQAILDSGLFYDRVVKIEEVQSRHTHVYDLTTRISRNFSDKLLVISDTFHHAGCSAMNVTLGVPRLKELINVSKSIKSPSMRIKPREPDFQASELCGVYMKDLILRGQILEKLESPVFEKTYIRMMDNEAFQESIEQTDWSVLYEMDIAKLHTHGLDLLDITVWINKTFNHVWCSCSDENAENPRVIVRLFVNNNGMDNHAKMKQLYCKMTQETVIQGYKNITRVLENAEGYIETLGIDMENVMANARVDPYRTRCNDVMTTFNTLGIEAARQVLYDEICKVIEFDGSYVDYRHTAMLIDTMTYKGSLMAITRHGINRTETGVLMRCSFEETVNVITDAAAFGEYDPIRGVTENIIMGKMACLGTGTMDVMVDAEKFMNSFYPETFPTFVPSNPVKYEDFDETFVPE